MRASVCPLVATFCSDLRFLHRPLGGDQTPGRYQQRVYMTPESCAQAPCGAGEGTPLIFGASSGEGLICNQRSWRGDLKLREGVESAQETRA